ncbi:NADAR family protein [Nocardia puris]|uniref:RibA/ribD-fused uncharacterized protein n=1 Tax=Nocardia puris TaxID=208602 RepID=A0A366D533_9NOCA|nr:NADAR family protein [Nocardia puris]RBO85153.1 ribA/ribD-fused uncharacterized protein [Nocardia puris]
MASYSHSSVVEEFRGSYFFLSNFSRHPVRWEGRRFPTAEHAFAAAKTTDPGWVERIQAAPDPRSAKALGRECPLRPGWDDDRRRVMAEIVASKFNHDGALIEQLLGTGTRLLIEGNSWGDHFWGRSVQRGARVPVGANHLGRILMQVRRGLSGRPDSAWTRVALTGHREHLIEPQDRAWVRGELRRLAVKLRDQHHTEVAASGLATGSDQWWAAAAIDAGLDVWGYQPFPGQAANWSPDQQVDHTNIVAAAARLVLVSEQYDTCAFQLRNQLLLGDADAIIAVHDRRITQGGTVSALRSYAQGMPVITVDPATRTTTLRTVYRTTDSAVPPTL